MLSLLRFFFSTVCVVVGLAEVVRPWEMSFGDRSRWEGRVDEVCVGFVVVKGVGLAVVDRA